MYTGEIYRELLDTYWSKKMVDFLHAECYSEAYSDDKYTIYDEQGSDELDGKGI